MNIQVSLKRIKLKSKQVVFWNQDDLGYKKYAGSVYFTNMNYNGFITHENKVHLFNNGKDRGFYNFEELKN